ncbi:MAG: hypothetical protein HPY83_13595 [Anaerolineae bacterium]|nr:hypothetical protein [Anaerolineae bacterium]
MTAERTAQPSDLAQALHLLSWLDEEHRRDRAEIARLQQRLESQATEIGEQARRIQDLESRLVAVQAQQVRVPEFGRQAEALKREFTGMIEALEEERRRGEREAARLRIADVEAQSRALAELRKRVDLLPELQDRLETRQAEDRRLSQEIVALRERVTEVSKAIGDWPMRAAYLEEQRIQDAKRIAQLQQEVSELFKRVEPYPSRLEFLEEQIRKGAADLEELRGTIPQISEKHAEFAGRYLRDHAEITRQLTEWGERVQQFEQTLERYSREMRTFREAHDDTRRSLETIAQLDERLARDAHQIAEAQRVAEERQRRELEEWQEEGNKRWSRHEMESARAMADVQNRLDDLGERIANLAATVEAIHPEIERLWRALEVEAEAYLEAAQERFVLVTRQREG